MKRIARLWRSSRTTPEPAPESTAVTAMDVDKEESTIDLTSDTEACAEGGEDSEVKGKVSGREIWPEAERKVERTPP